MRALVNPHVDQDAVEPPSDAARVFHRALPGYAPTPVRELAAVAEGLGLGAVAVKDESARLGLPAFKVLGASWAIDEALREDPAIRTLVAASAGNHGRAVAHVAAARGLRARVFLPARALPARREAIAAEGAAVVVVDGDYEDAVRLAAAAAGEATTALITDVGTAPSAHRVVDGYATLFAELTEAWDVLLVPAGVGSLAAAACRYGATSGAAVVAVEPTTAACVTASLAAGRPTRIDTPGTTMAGLDCAEVSAAAWPTLRAGLAATILVTDDEIPAATAELERAGLAIGESGASTLVALGALVDDPGAADLRGALDLGGESRVLLVATEGPTGTPEADGDRAAVRCAEAEEGTAGA